MTGSKPSESELGRVIYQGPEQMTKLIRSIKRLSISTTVLSAAVQPILIPKLMASGTPITIYFAGLTCAGVIVSPLILNWFTKRYVTELNYNERTQQFSAQHLNLINRPVRLQYKAEDVVVPENLGLFTTYIAKKKPFFVDHQLVLDFEPYKKMLGYDKPIDLKSEQIIEEIRKLKAERAKSFTEPEGESQESKDESKVVKRQSQ